MTQTRGFILRDLIFFLIRRDGDDFFVHDVRHHGIIGLEHQGAERHDADQALVDALQQKLQGWENVETVNYKSKEAALMCLQTVLLFRHAPERPEALAKLYTVLQEMKDPNAAKFGEMLKREYPDSAFTKKLFGKK